MHLNAVFLRGLLICAVLLAAVIFFITYTIKKAAEPKQIARKWAITIPLVALMLFSVSLFGLFGPFVIVACAVVLSFLWTPHLGEFVSRPITGLFDGGALPPEPRPAYSIAISRQKQGHYVEAVAEIRKQLDRFPTDIEGHLLLAQILAENLQDLPGAELTIHRWCSQPGHAPKNIAFALYSLADWHLHFGQDRESARRALEKIIELLPDTEFALGAAQRIAHLGSAEMLIAGADARKFVVPEGMRNLGLVPADQQSKPVAPDPEKLAADYVKHLQEHPLDTDAREKLAVLYVDHYKRLDLATTELEQLIAEPQQPSRRVVHWLNLLADLQIRSGAPHEIVVQTLERIIEKYPNVAAAEMARKRLGLVKLELKAQQTGASVKLGTYEQNIGLKGRKQ